MSIRRIKIYFILFILLFNVNIILSLGFFNLKYLLSSITGDNEDELSSNLNGIQKQDEYREICEENKLMLHLASLYAISPERILLLATTKTIPEMCNNIDKTRMKIENDFKYCRPLNPNNLYMKLYESLKIFYDDMCENVGRAKRLQHFSLCLRELYEEFVDCEGPAAWYELTNEENVCEIFNDVINCFYIKAAEICGLNAAIFLRGVSIDVFKKVTPDINCKVTSKLPMVKEPMPDGTIKFHSFHKCSILQLITILTIYNFL